MVWPAIIAAGATLASGLMARDAQEDANDQAKEAAQSGIRWRVADAKAAGLHPLFALGGGGATYSPAPATAFAESIGRAGQDISRAVQAAQGDDEHELKRAQLEQVRAAASKDTAQAAYFDSLAARERQAAPVSLMPAARSQSLAQLRASEGVDVQPLMSLPGGMEGGSVRERAARRPGGPPGIVPEFSGPVRQVEPKADPVISSRRLDPGISAGTHTGFNEITLFPGSRESGIPVRMLIFRSEEGPQEGTESLSLANPVGLWLTLRANVQHYGWHWLARVAALPNPTDDPWVARLQQGVRYYINRGGR